MKIYTLYFMLFFLLITVFSVAIPAQEAKVEIRVEKQESVKDGEVIIYSDGDVMLMDGKNAPGEKIQVEEFKGDAVEINGNQIKIKGLQQNSESGVNQVEKPSSETRRMNREKEMSLDETKNLKAMRKAQEKMERKLNEGEKGSSEMSKPAEEYKRAVERPGGANKGAGPGDEGLKRYLDAVVNKNLFLPLGSGPEEKKSSFAVTGLISTNTNSRKEDKAIIEEIGSNKGYYVSEGDKFAGNVEVLEIDNNVVKLDRSGEQMTLKLGEGTGGGRGGWSGGGGGRPSGGQERNRQEVSKKQETASRPSGDNFDPSQIPPFALEILKQRGISIEELQNNPDLREKLRAEFTERFGGGGGESSQGRIRGRNR